MKINNSLKKIQLTKPKDNVGKRYVIILNGLILCIYILSERICKKLVNSGSLKGKKTGAVDDGDFVFIVYHIFFDVTENFNYVTCIILSLSKK